MITVSRTSSCAHCRADASPEPADAGRHRCEPLRAFLTAVLAVLAIGAWMQAEAQSLAGSKASLDRQNEQAHAHDYSYLERPKDVRRFVESGLLVPVQGNANYQLASVSFPHARPAVRTFIRRLGRQYRSACGEPLVVTSLVRPHSRQPRNASDESVHPTGMAVDLRRSRKASCRRWLERVLLQLEGQGVLEATRERRPPHYHVALFPRPYLHYIGARSAQPAPPPQTAEGSTYRVRRGDSLWRIAKRYGTTCDRLAKANGLHGTRLLAGQILRLPEEIEFP